MKLRRLFVIASDWMLFSATIFLALHFSPWVFVLVPLEILAILAEMESEQ